MLNVNEFVRRGHRVTLIVPLPYHYYSGYGPWDAFREIQEVDWLLAKIDYFSEKLMKLELT